MPEPDTLLARWLQQAEQARQRQKAAAWEAAQRDAAIAEDQRVALPPQLPPTAEARQLVDAVRRLLAGHA